MQASSNQFSEEVGRHRREQEVQLERWLPYRLFTIATRVADVLNSYYGPRYGLSRAAWRTMAIIGNRKGISAKEICQAAGLDQFAVSRALGQLVELGFACRQTARNDKRYAAIALTEAGWTALQEISALSRKIESELIDQITPKEAAILDGILDKFEAASAGILMRGWQGLVPEEGGGTPGPPTKSGGE
jgi:DNA-binding MarR family transcriptional regulator